MTRQQWCFHSLFLNITHALGTYLRTALSVLSLKSKTHTSSLSAPEVLRLPAVCSTCPPTRTYCSRPTFNPYLTRLVAVALGT
jgi:hypothetical protein